MLETPDTVAELAPEAAKELLELVAQVWRDSASLIARGLLTLGELRARLRVALSQEVVKSTIDALDPELRVELERLLGDKRFTIRSIVAHMRELGVEVSKSAVHRHRQTLDKIARDIRMAREVASAIGKELEETDGSITRAVVESLQALVLRAQTQVEDEDGTIDPKAVGSLAQAARDLASALKSSVDAELKIRAKVVKEAAEAATKVVTERGLSEEVANAIKASILGVSDRKASS